MSPTTRMKNTLTAAALVCVPWLAFAQATPAPASMPTTVVEASAPAQSAPRTREDVSREVREAMRDGSWRCLTNSRGWCSTPASTRGGTPGKEAVR